MTTETSRSYATFILTHGRPAHVLTWKVLRNSGYTGRLFLVVDNEDDTIEEYRDRFGAENVLVFDKAAVAKTFDTADTQEDRRTIVYARNACFDLAEQLGVDYFVELDDDYTSFQYRYLDGAKIKGPAIWNMDDVYEAMFDLLDSTGAGVVAFSQGGDHIGGASGEIAKGYKRKAMNSLFMRTDSPLRFVGRINEDVNTYVVAGSRGTLFLTSLNLQLGQKQTQQGSGGMSDVYLAAGTYVKSFYTVMMAPSCCKIRSMGTTSRRIHHSVKWDHAVPKILAPEHRKPRP